MATTNRDLQNKFIEWLRLPPQSRGDIASEAEWGRRHGVTDRTLRRWKTLPWFVERLEAPPDAAPTVTVQTVEPATADEADYRVVKGALVEGAKSGNPKYLDLYFRTYGKPFVEEEVASRATDLSGMDLDDLVSRALSVLAIDAIVNHLRSLGWSVERS